MHEATEGKRMKLGRSSDTQESWRMRYPTREEQACWEQRVGVDPIAFYQGFYRRGRAVPIVRSKSHFVRLLLVVSSGMSLGP